MARIWKGRRKSASDPMAGGYITSPHPAPRARQERDPIIDPATCYFVRVCGFTFEFWSADHIAVALDYFRRKVHASSRVGGNWGEHDVTQRWYERLPLELQQTGKRERVVAGLEQALEKFA
jgi:hypothetical protein